MDGALVEGRGPIKNFDGGRHGHCVTQQRKQQRGVDRDSGDKHVVRPDQEAEDCDGNRRKGHEAVSEDPFARETGNDLADNSHRRQNHDVHGRMGVEPEQMLKQ